MVSVEQEVILEGTGGADSYPTSLLKVHCREITPYGDVFSQFKTRWGKVGSNEVSQIALFVPSALLRMEVTTPALMFIVSHSRNTRSIDGSRSSST